jgi:hypothetical protein
MARKKSSMMMYEPTPQDQMDYAMNSAVEKAVLNHPHTIKLRKTIEKEMQKAAKVMPQQNKVTTAKKK